MFMAKVTKRDDAPSDAKNFSLGNVEFSLPRKNSVYETDSADVISNARVHPYLQVEAPVPDEETEAARDLLDPHVNPSADHLSIAASDSAIAAAEANEAAIRESTGLADTYGAPDKGSTTAAVTSAVETASDTADEVELPDVTDPDPEPAEQPAGSEKKD